MEIVSEILNFKDPLAFGALNFSARPQPNRLFRQTFKQYGYLFLVIVTIHLFATISQVDYKEKAAAGGQFPRSFARRDIGASDRDILISRRIGW